MDYLSKDQILQLVYNFEKHRVNSRIIQLINQNDREQLRLSINTLTSFLPDEVSFNQRIWHLLNNDYTIHTCKQCKMPTLFRNMHTGYQKYCSKKCAASSPERSTLINQTKMDRYGSLISTKAVATNMGKYGVPFPLQNEQVLQKSHASQGEMWGFKNQVVKGHARQTKIERYGVANGNVGSYAHVTEHQHQMLKNKPLLAHMHHQDEMSATEMAGVIGVNRSTVLRSFVQLDIPIVRHYATSHERKVASWLSEMQMEVTRNRRDIIYPLELDLVVDQYRLAIEIDGIWYHSERYGYPKDRHLVKHRCANFMDIS